MENLVYILSNSFLLFYWLYTIYCLMKYSKGISRPEFLGMLFTRTSKRKPTCFNRWIKMRFVNMLKILIFKLIKNY